LPPSVSPPTACDHGVAARDGGGDSTAQADLVDDTRRPGRNPVARQVHGEIADVGGTPGWSISAAPTVLPGPVAAVVGSPVEEFGRLYMAFNNAGIMISLSNAADEPVEAFAESLPSICAGSGPRYHYAQNWTVSKAAGSVAVWTKGHFLRFFFLSSYSLEQLESLAAAATAVNRERERRYQNVTRDHDARQVLASFRTDGRHPTVPADRRPRHVASGGVRPTAVTAAGIPIGDRNDLAARLVEAINAVRPPTQVTDAFA
jgi:hypothetical protein